LLQEADLGAVKAGAAAECLCSLAIGEAGGEFGAPARLGRPVDVPTPLRDNQVVA
jgi:hypothetical protein